MVTHACSKPFIVNDFAINLILKDDYCAKSLFFKKGGKAVKRMSRCCKCKHQSN